MFEIDLHVKETPHWPWIPQTLLNSRARVVDDGIVLDFFPADPGRVCAITNTYCYAWFNALSQEERPIQKLEKVTWLPNINTARDKQVWYQSCRSSQSNQLTEWHVWYSKKGSICMRRQSSISFYCYCLTSETNYEMCSELSFQECQNSKQTWKSGIVSPCGAERRLICCPLYHLPRVKGWASVQADSKAKAPKGQGFLSSDRNSCLWRPPPLLWTRRIRTPIQTRMSCWLPSHE